MKKEHLYKIGFKDELANKPNGILNYQLIEEASNETFLQVCLKSTDVYPTLVVYQYDWNNMKSNLTYLPMLNIRDVETLKTEIENLKRLFVV